MCDHADALQDATEPDERWETLAGHLHDPAVERELVPDEIAAKVARSFAFTSHGRLFYLKANGDVSERACHDGQFDVVVDGTRWQPRRSALMRRIFPGETGSEGPDDWSDVDPDDPERRPDWLGDLAPKTQPDHAPVQHREIDL